MGKESKLSTVPPGPMGGSGCSTEKTVEVRKISNGYMRRESEWGNGDYKSSETYHASDPGMDLDKGGKSIERSSLSEAVRNLKGK